MFLDCVHGVSEWMEGYTVKKCTILQLAVIYVRMFLDCVHGVSKWMEGYTVNKVYTITARCYICENVSRSCTSCEWVNGRLHCKSSVQYYS